MYVLRGGNLNGPEDVERAGGTRCKLEEPMSIIFENVLKMNCILVRIYMYEIIWSVWHVSATTGHCKFSDRSR